MGICQMDLPLLWKWSSQETHFYSFDCRGVSNSVLSLLYCHFFISLPTCFLNGSDKLRFNQASHNSKGYLQGVDVIFNRSSNPFLLPSVKKSNSPLSWGETKHQCTLAQHSFYFYGRYSKGTYYIDRKCCHVATKKFGIDLLQAAAYGFSYTALTIHFSKCAFKASSFVIFGKRLTFSKRYIQYFNVQVTRKYLIRLIYLYAFEKKKSLPTISYFNGYFIV